jgi:Darcynin, domain of unknown function
LAHAAFLGLTATPAWLALDRLERERIVAKELRPILDRHRRVVSARYYGTEAYTARASDLLRLEFDDPGAHAKLIDELRNSSMFTAPYFTLGDLLVGKQAAWLEPS